MAARNLTITHVLLLMYLACHWVLVYGKETKPERTSRSCGTLAEVSQELWINDVNRLPPGDITLNYQSRVPEKSKTDLARDRLFTSVNETKLSGPTFKSFLSLLDNYQPVNGVRESMTPEEVKENNAFISAVLDTEVMSTLLNYLQCKGLVDNQDHLRFILTKLWFDFYQRSESSHVKDTSGFEHVMVGEYKSKKKVNGFHNWLSFYVKEKTNQIDYFGYVAKKEPNLIGAAFKWNGRFKSLATFFLGVSPEFDLSIYTLCYLTNPNRKCPIVVNGYNLEIQSYDKNGHVATAYVY